MSVRTAIINAVGDTYSEMPIREVMRGSDAILSALRSAGFATITEAQFVEVACMLYCLGATDRIAGRPQNAVPASRQAWSELLAMVTAAQEDSRE